MVTAESQWVVSSDYELASLSLSNCGASGDKSYVDDLKVNGVLYGAE